MNHVRSLHYYSTDPALSLSRHEDPDYVNSSDPPLPSSSDTAMSVDPIPSSPPGSDIKMDDLYARHVPTYDRSQLYDHSPLRDDDQAGDTDEDTDDDSRDVTFTGNFLEPLSQPSVASSMGNFYASSQSTMKQDSQIIPASRAGSLFVPIASRTASLRQNRAERAIDRVFEGTSNAVNLDQDDYEAVPDACRALADHEDLGGRRYHLSLSKNHIRFIDKFLYRIDRLKYLNLRENDITELTAMISELVNLNELHLGHNKLQTLPAELFNLPELKTLTTHPNEYLMAPEDGSARLIRYSKQPSLVDFSQRAIAQAGFDQEFPDFRRLLAGWAGEFPQLVQPILYTVQIGRVCSVCFNPIVRPLATFLNWTRHPADHSAGTVPYQTVLCSDTCIHALAANFN